MTAVNGNSVTIKLRGTEGSKTFRITSDTAVDRSTTGQSSNLVEGATVLVQPNYGSGPSTASEIVVLPSSTTFGSRLIVGGVPRPPIGGRDSPPDNHTAAVTAPRPDRLSRSG